MASDVDICNEGLGYLGDEANVSSINPSDGSPQADLCSRFFPLAKARVLERYHFSFATTRAANLAALNVTVDGWNYVFAAPSDMVVPQSLRPVGWQRNDPPSEFTYEIDENEQTLIYTDVSQPVLIYTKLVSTGRLTPLAGSAVAAALAAMLAGPLLKGEAGREGAQAMNQLFEKNLALAAASDARAQRINLNMYPDWMQARGVWPNQNMPEPQSVIW